MPFRRYSPGGRRYLLLPLQAGILWRILLLQRGKMHSRVCGRLLLQVDQDSQGAASDDAEAGRRSLFSVDCWLFEENER